MSFRKQSSSGRPTVTAVPFRMPRRTRRRVSRASLELRIMELSSARARGFPHGRKSAAERHGAQQVRQPVAVGRELLSEPAQDRLVRRLRRAAGGVAVDALDEAGAELGVIVQRLREAGEVVERRPSRTPLGSIAAPCSVSRNWPAPSKFSSASPIGSVILWQPAHTGLVRCRSRRSRAVFSRESGSSSSEKSTFGGGRGTVWHSSSSRTALPRSVGELRPGWACAARKLTWVRSPCARCRRGSYKRSSPAAPGRRR